MKPAELLSCVLVLLSPEAEAQAPKATPRLNLERSVPVEFTGRSAWSVTWLAVDVLGLADPEALQILVLNTRTGKLSRVGRKGSGPGEFQGVNPPVKGPSGELLVYDPMLRRISIFSKDADFVRSFSLPLLVWGVLEWKDPHQVRALWLDTRSRMAPRLGHLLLAAAGGQVGGVIALDSLFSVHIPTLTAPYSAAAVFHAGYTYVGDPRAYRILKTAESGSVLAVFERNLKTGQISAEDVEARMKSAASALEKLSPEMQARAKRTISEAKRPFFLATGLSVDGKGRLWVVTDRFANASTEVDLFLPNGQFAGTVRIEGKVRSLAWRGAFAAAVVEDNDGIVEAIRIYRLSE